jgi:ankyrin repeat protein
MFPNPQDALPLPARPNLQRYRKLAKDLVKACKSDDTDSLRAWAVAWVTALARLADNAPPAQPPARMEQLINEVEEFVGRKLRDSRGATRRCALADAQFVIARSHGFASWPKFAKHLEGLARTSSPVTQFESAANAIVAGDVPRLGQLLRQNPELIRARSTREHGATLLHYVSANGVEGYRQKTPANAVRIAEILLKSGADVNAEADVYGGGATALGLVATSIHPERAGVQVPLMETLLHHGARLDQPGSAGNRHSAVKGCLANGRAQAAEFLAARGAALDLEEAAGVGRLDVVKTFFKQDGTLKANATEADLQAAFGWACEYGRLSVVEFLLENGVDIRAQSHGQTGLHWAVIGGQLEVVRLLLARGAPLENTNIYAGTALGQALWSGLNGESAIDYVPIIETLLNAGAQIKDGSLAWLEKQESGSASVRSRIASLLRSYGAKS